MKKIIRLIIIIILCSSCNYESNKEILISDKILGLNEEIIQLNNEIEFIEKFKKTNKKSNILKDFVVDSLKLNGMRINHIQSFTNLDFDDPYTYIAEKFVIAGIYDTSRSAYLQEYGYIFSAMGLMKNKSVGLMINKSLDQLYYIFWENELIPTIFSHSFEVSSIIDSTTKTVTTNIDTNLVRKIFNYEGVIEKTKIKSLEISFKKEGAYFEKYNVKIK